MLDSLEIRPEYRELLESAGLADFDSIMSCDRGVAAGRHRRRDVTRLELACGDMRLGLFLKRDRRPLLKDLLAGLWNGWGWATKARWEWRAILGLQAAGIGCAQPVAFGQRGLWRARGFLMLAELPNAVVLPHALAGASPAERRLLTVALARELARLHGAGFDHPDLYSKHVWVARRDGAWRIFLLDLQRTRRRRSVAWRRRLRDLSALNSTVAPEYASSLERLRFLRIYLDASGGEQRFRRAAAQLNRRTKKLLARPAIARRRFAAAPPEPELGRLQPSDDVAAPRPTLRHGYPS